LNLQGFGLYLKDGVVAAFLKLCLRMEGKHVAFLKLWLRMASFELWLRMEDEH